MWMRVRSLFSSLLYSALDAPVVRFVMGAGEHLFANNFFKCPDACRVMCGVRLVSRCFYGCSIDKCMRRWIIDVGDSRWARNAAFAFGIMLNAHSGSMKDGRI